MQVTNGNERFTTFPTMTNMKNISLITEIEFMRTLIILSLFSKKFEHKVSIFDDKVRENAMNQNEKPQRAKK